MKLSWTKTAMRELRKVSGSVADRITRKMEWFAAQDNPLSFAKPLTHPLSGRYRFRVGNYRIICRNLL